MAAFLCPERPQTSPQAASDISPRFGSGSSLTRRSGGFLGNSTGVQEGKERGSAPGLACCWYSSTPGGVCRYAVRPAGAQAPRGSRGSRLAFVLRQEPVDHPGSMRKSRIATYPAAPLTAPPASLRQGRPRTSCRERPHAWRSGGTNITLPHASAAGRASTDGSRRPRQSGGGTCSCGHASRARARRRARRREWDKWDIIRQSTLNARSRVTARPGPANTRHSGQTGPNSRSRPPYARRRSSRGDLLALDQHAAF